MYKELAKILICPECMKELSLSIMKEENEEVTEGKLSCENNHKWIIKDGIINFGAKEQVLSNNWEQMYKNYDYAELDRRISYSTPENMKQINNKTKDIIIEKLNNQDSKIILDIATGRGMLLTELVKKFKIDAQIICTDLSFDVLRYDRLKTKSTNKNVKVNYIACDATKLPIKENSIDVGVSFYGIANMLDKMPFGISEVKRVLKEGKSLLNSGVIIKENSQGYKAMKDWLNSQEIYGVDKLFTEVGFENVHKSANFKYIDILIVAEDIAQKCENDIIPFEGEWFSIVIAECKK